MFTISSYISKKLHGPTLLGAGGEQLRVYSWPLDSGYLFYSPVGAPAELKVSKNTGNQWEVCSLIVSEPSIQGQIPLTL